MKQRDTLSPAEKTEEFFYHIRNLVMDHRRVVLPSVFFFCFALTVVFALAARHFSSDRIGLEPAGEGTSQAAEQAALEENRYPEVNALMERYFGAVAEGDVQTIASISTSMDETEKIRIRKLGDYVESYPDIDVYTKPGPVENSYICFVVTRVRFAGYDAEIPGMQTMYVCTAADGSLYINEDESSAEVMDYIRRVSLEDDVVDLNNLVTAEYNDMLAADASLSPFLDTLSSQIEVSIGEALADARDAAQEDTSTADGADAASSGESADSTDGEAASDTDAASGAGSSSIPANAKTAIAREPVAVRSTDNAEGEQIGSVYQGDRLKVKEVQSNGWTKVEYKGGTAYVKSEFFDYE